MFGIVSANILWCILLSVQLSSHLDESTKHNLTRTGPQRISGTTGTRSERLSALPGLSSKLMGWSHSIWPVSQWPGSGWLYCPIQNGREPDTFVRPIIVAFAAPEVTMSGAESLIFSEKQTITLPITGSG